MQVICPYAKTKECPNHKCTHGTESHDRRNTCNIVAYACPHGSVCVQAKDPVKRRTRTWVWALYCSASGCRNLTTEIEGFTCEKCGRVLCDGCVSRDERDRGTCKECAAKPKGKVYASKKMLVVGWRDKFWLGYDGDRPIQCTDKSKATCFESRNEADKARRWPITPGDSYIETTTIRKVIDDPGDGYAALLADGWAISREVKEL